MNVLLIYPVRPPSHWPVGRFRSFWVPTGLAYLAAGLRRAGHAVRVHVREEQLIKNGMDWQGADQEIRRLLTEFQPDMVGLSATTPCIPEASALARLAKEICGPGVTVIAGGPHPSAVPEMTLAECPQIDAVVVGEGEETIVELANRGLGKDVAGIVIRDPDRPGEFIRTPARPLVTDLDRLGPLPYDLFDMKHYTQPSRWLIRWLELPATNIRTSRGCTNRCRFCGGHLVSGVGVRCHSIPYVIQQMRYAVEQFGVKAILFEDETLGAHRARLMDLCEAIRRNDLHKRVVWQGCLRVDQVDAELLAGMKSAGCIQIEYGFESGSDEALQRLGKGARVEQNRRAVRLMREAGLRTFADIMVGLPGETEEDFGATLAFLRWAKPQVIGLARLCPLPGTPVFQNLPEEARQSLDWAGYSYLDHPGFRLNLTAMPDARFERLYRQLDKYVIRPATTLAMLRDTPPGDVAEHRRLRKQFRRFALRHPLRAIRLPR